MMPSSEVSAPSGVQRACASVRPAVLRMTADRRDRSQRRKSSASSAVPFGKSGSDSSSMAAMYDDWARRARSTAGQRLFVQRGLGDAFEAGKVLVPDQAIAGILVVGAEPFVGPHTVDTGDA